MTIDERLERLAERHEALIRSSELFRHDMAEMRAAAAERDAITDQRISRIRDLLERQSSNIDKLAAVAHEHQQRIERLET